VVMFVIISLHKYLWKGVQGTALTLFGSTSILRTALNYTHTTYNVKDIAYTFPRNINYCNVIQQHLKK
jgi:hypothetical protein